MHQRVVSKVVSEGRIVLALYLGWRHSYQGQELLTLLVMNWKRPGSSLLGTLGRYIEHVQLTRLFESVSCVQRGPTCSITEAGV